MILYLQNLLKRLGKSPGKGRQRDSRNWRCTLELESLESRQVLSTVTNLFDAGPGSLRQAIFDTPAGGTVDFQPGLTGTITLTSGELAINRDLNIAGPGADVITVSGNTQSRVFEIATPTVNATISALTIAHGYVYMGVGGGIQSVGTLTVSDCVLSGNEAFAGGGGISNAGTLTVSDCVLTNNQARYGGGIYNYNADGGLVTITHSMLKYNNATYSTSGIPTLGGGIYNNGGTVSLTDSTLSGSSSAGGTSLAGGTVSEGGDICNTGTMTVTRSTLSGNSVSALSRGSATSAGGAVYNSGELNITNSTIYGNSVSVTALFSSSSGNSSGGGIYNTGVLTLVSTTLSGNSASNRGPGSSSGGGVSTTSAGVTTVRNTLVAGNTAGTAPDVNGTLASQGYNLISDGTGGSGFVDTDLVGTSANPIDPMLGPLQNNGGPTQTIALLPGSPAINAGDNTGAPDTDQRGFARIVGGTIDIGAFEVQAAGQATHFGFQAPAIITAGTPFAIMVTALDDFGQQATGYTGAVQFTGAATATATFTFTGDNMGQHTFYNLVLTRAGAYTVAGADTANPLITGSTAFSITPAAPDHIAFSGPTTITAEMPFAITATVQDAYGNSVTGYLGTVHFMLIGQAIAQADYTFTTADMGSHTFPHLVLNDAGDYTLTGVDQMDSSIRGSTYFTVLA
jgi:hypothetical protein